MTGRAVGSSTVADRGSLPASDAGAPVVEAAADDAGSVVGPSTTGSVRSSATAGVAPRPSRGATPAVAPPLATAPSGRPDQAPTTTASSVSIDGPTSLERAVADRDLCALYDGLGELEISGRTVSEFRSGMATVLGAVAAARSFVPDELAETWSVLVTRTERVVEVLSEPGASVSAAAEVFADDTYRNAMDRVDAWMAANCG